VKIKKYASALRDGEYFSWSKEGQDWQVVRAGRAEGGFIWLTLKDPQGIQERPRQYAQFAEVWTY
jgi:hypothetical protein